MVCWFMNPVLVPKEHLLLKIMSLCLIDRGNRPNTWCFLICSLVYQETAKENCNLQGQLSFQQKKLWKLIFASWYEMPLLTSTTHIAGNVSWSLGCLDGNGIHPQVIAFLLGLFQSQFVEFLWKRWSWVSLLSLKMMLIILFCLSSSKLQKQSSTRMEW